MPTVVAGEKFTLLGLVAEIHIDGNLLAGVAVNVLMLWIELVDQQRDVHRTIVICVIFCVIRFAQCLIAFADEDVKVVLTFDNYSCTNKHVKEFFFEPRVDDLRLRVLAMQKKFADRVCHDFVLSVAAFSLASLCV